MTDYKKFGFREADDLSDMKSNNGRPSKTGSSLSRDRDNLPSSATSGISRKQGKSAFSNTPVGENRSR